MVVNIASQRKERVIASHSPDEVFTTVPLLRTSYLINLTLVASITAHPFLSLAG